MLLRPAKGRAVRNRETRVWAMLASSAGLSLALTGLAAAGVTARPGYAAVTASTVTVASPGPQASKGVVANVSGNVPAHSGSWLAWLGGYTTPHTDTIEQTVTIPASCNSATLVFWLQIASNVPRSEAVDTFRAQVVSPGGSVLA